nr:hypothetical protein [uncultured Flavobacterium sp.]
MIFIVNTGTVSFITRIEFTLAEWDKRFDKFLRVVGFISDEEFLDELRFSYHLDDKAIEDISEIISKKNFTSIRIKNNVFKGFEYAENYLDFTAIEGQILYFEDWNFIFRIFNEEYFLWCFLGGIADVQREIKLSEEHVKRYKEIGLAQIDYLIDNLQKKDSIEYEKAIVENRKLL